MEMSVLTLGEKVVLAARLAAIEHVRLELDAAQTAASERAARPVGDRADGFTDESDADALSKPVGVLLGEVFGRLERETPMPRATRPKSAKRPQQPRRRGAA